MIGRAMEAANAELSRHRFFVCGVSDAGAVVLQCSGHEHAVMMECAAWMSEKASIRTCMNFSSPHNHYFCFTLYRKWLLSAWFRNERG